jgi:hypothetical protein
MHITYPFIFRPVGILLFQVEIFCYLTPDAHDISFYRAKLQRRPGIKREALEESRAVHIRNPNYCYMRRIFGVD